MDLTTLQTTHPHLHAWIIEASQGDAATAELLRSEYARSDDLAGTEALARLYAEHRALAQRSGRWDLAHAHFEARRPVDELVQLEHALGSSSSSRRGRA